MKKLTFIFLLGFLLFSVAMPSCKKEEITQVEYIVPIWKGSLKSAPSNPEVGWAYYDTEKMQSFIYDGSSWQVMAQDGKNGVNGHDGLNGQDGLGIEWKGNLPTAPTNPKTNWAYYDTEKMQSFIYDGSLWQVMAQDGKNGVNGQNGLNGQDGLGIEWKGNLPTAPSDPKTNWAYYNTTEGISYIFNGSEWSYLAKDGRDRENGNNDQINEPTLDCNIEWDYISNEFYPSFTYMQLLCAAFGEASECITVTIPKDAVGSKITLTINANQFMDQTILSETITADKVKNGIWTYSPTINWNQEALLSADQPGFFNLNAVLEVNGKEVKRITKRIIYHSINDCVYGFIQENKYINAKFLFCAYVNEDNPRIDEILQSCLAMDNIRQFFGDQGTKQDVINQMYWIWEYFALRNTRYSSITNTSSNDSKVNSQYVRFFDQCINNNQANCVDGSCLLASIYKKIGLDVGLVLIPGHCFLVVRPHTSDVIGQEDANVIFLETTLMGSASNPYNENDRIDSFNDAVQTGWDEVANLVNTGKTDEILMFFIDDLRQKGIKPIPRSR